LELNQVKKELDAEKEARDKEAKQHAEYDKKLNEPNFLHQEKDFSEPIKDEDLKGMRMDLEDAKRILRLICKLIYLPILYVCQRKIETQFCKHQIQQENVRSVPL
jgi:hypothetical protein